MKHSLAALFLCLSLLLCAAPPAKFDAASRMLLDRQRMHPAPLSRSGSSCAAFLSLAPGADAAMLEACGLELLSVAGDVAVVRGDTDALEAAAELDAVRSLRIASPLKPANDLSRADTHADRLTQAPGIDGTTYTGRSVVAGLFDTGFDFGHPAFLRDGTSRVKALWHYTGSDGSCNEYSSPEAVMAFGTDTTELSHGTHVLGTIAGDYPGSPYNGVAVGADLAVACGSLYDANIADGVSRIASYARSQGKPCVINLSISDFAGPRDGTDDFSRALSAATAGSGDAILVISAGNYNTDNHSFSRVLSADDPALRTFLIPEMWIAKGDGVLSVWGADGRPLKITIVMYDWRQHVLHSSYTVESGAGNELYLATTDFAMPPGAGDVPFVRDEHFSKAYTDSYAAVYYDTDTSNGRPNCLLAYQLQLNIAGGNGTADLALGIIVEGEPGQRVDLNLDCNTTMLHSGWEKGWSMGANELSISSMACAEGVVSVGAYTTRNQWSNLAGESFDYTDRTPLGDIAPWSSRGTLIDGSTRPHVAAPGSQVISPYSTPFVEAHPDDDGPVLKIAGDGRDDYWGFMCGTSMSAPAVAGAIALWLEADPSLGADDVLDIIAATSRREPLMDANAEAWGAGKFDAEAGLREVLARKAALAGPSAVAPAGLILRRGGSQLAVDVPGSDDFTAYVHDLSGRLVKSACALEGSATIDTASLSPGIYIITACGYSRRILL